MNAPTLLIGLGGAGCKIIERVYKMATPEEQKNIAYAVFDTDINDLTGIEKRNPLIRTVQTSTKQTVGEYLNIDTHARDSWFPVNAILNGKTLTEGAGQVRSISRLALETVIRAGKMEPLHEAIQSLYKVEEDKRDQALRVVICSSLAGGTGSGLILPIALYVRNYLATHFRQSANITRGFFILPEVFYEVIKGETERNNLKANAYATLRELDAFLMKGDATLPERYQDSVKVQFPRVASTGYEEYDVRPYDFCFLFDAQNAEGGKLNSHDQYLDHAANCIYAQSIGPMNKRSNSSEDNTIRKLAKERGRNRYAGAGASMLIYPAEDIRTFLALKWAKQCVSSQWLVFDNIYKEVCEENRKAQEQGLLVQNPDSAAFYATQIESMASQKHPLASAIVKSCGRYSSDGISRKGDHWEDFVAAVEAKTAKDIRAGSRDLQVAEESASMMIGSLGTDWEDYVDAYYEAERYRLMSQNYVEEKAQTIGYTIFKSKVSFVNAPDYKLEKYLVGSDGNFLHPNAIRYFLIKTAESMRKHKLGVESDLAELKDFYENFERNTFDDPNTEDVVETPEDLLERKQSIKGRMSKKASAEQDEIKQKLRQYFNNVEEYNALYAQSVVLDRGIFVINSLVKAFESFYKTFDSKVETIDTRIEEIYRKYSGTKGTTARYVCASRECLDRIYEKRPFTGSAIKVDSELSKKIFERVSEYADMTEKPGNNRFFSELFDKGILGHFETTVGRECASEIDIDIITAIENEAVYEYHLDQELDPDTLIDQYVRKTINDTRELSCPFIESPMGEQREPINSCTFNAEMKPKRGDDSPRADLIRKELMNYGGEPDEDIPKSRIMFYQSFYGLRANDLSKFAPPERAMTYKREGGEYFKAYYDLIKGIHPETHRSKEISPHIDRWWHIVTKMPDLDDQNQKEQEHRIYAAFFWGIIGRYIDLFEDNNEKIYKFKQEILGMEDDRMIVSNGTECDKLYEVLDAIAIYPELVERILERIEILIESEVNKKQPIEKGILHKYLNNFDLEDPGLGPHGSEVHAKSIFDIPILMKKSSTKDFYYEESVIDMLRVQIDEIRRYLSVFCTPKELTQVMKAILDDQYKKFIADMQVETQNNPALYRESLFYRTCSIIAGAYDELGLHAEAEEIIDSADALRK